MSFIRPHDGRFVRTDIWREGEWLDLWSVVHLLSGASVGFTLYALRLSALASVLLAFLLFVAYEMWEKIVEIEETPANRFMDVVVGMVSFLPTFFLFAPPLPETVFILVFGFVLTANIVMSVFGWIASQKAAVLEKHLRERYARHRLRRLRAKERRREKRLKAKALRG